MTVLPRAPIEDPPGRRTPPPCRGQDENDARKAEYKALAEKEGVEVPVIVQRMTRRNYENARIGDMLKNDDGSWRKVRAPIWLSSHPL